MSTDQKGRDQCAAEHKAASAMLEALEALLPIYSSSDGSADHPVLIRLTPTTTRSSK